MKLEETAEEEGEPPPGDLPIDFSSYSCFDDEYQRKNRYKL
jgi:hypothetical protein